MHSKKPALMGLLAALALAAAAGAEPTPSDPHAVSSATATPSATTPGTPAAAAPQSGAAKPAAPAKPKRPHEENGIVALVNDLPITSYELKQRMGLIFATSGGLQHTPDMEKKVRDQVLDMLETELLQRQEAAKNDITVSSVEVDKYMQGILEDNRMNQEQLKVVLSRGGVQIATFRAQLAAQILWQKAVNEHYAGRVTISPEAVDSEMARIKEGSHKAHFQVSEIFLAVDNPDLDEKVKKNAEGLIAQITAGAQFPSIARQFSQSPSAAQGGDIGVVYDGQLAPELSAALNKMATGDMSAPIRSIGGYYILVLRQRFEPVGTKIEEEKPTAATLPPVLSLGRLLLRLPPKPPQEYMDKVMQVAKQIQQAVVSCDFASKVPQSVQGVLYFPLGQTHIVDLNQQTRDALAKTEIGGTAEPFRSDAGIEIFIRCETRIVKKLPFTLPSRDQVEQQLFSEQISALARRYNRDIRRSAHIEVR